MSRKAHIFSFDTAQESSGFLLWQATSLWHRGIQKVLKEYNITHAQFVVLASTAWLARSNRDITQIMLAEHSKIDVMTTSSVVRTLERKRLISRRAHPTDPRANRIMLTARGTALIKRSVHDVERFDERFFSYLSKTKTMFNTELKALVGGNSQNI